MKKCLKVLATVVAVVLSLGQHRVDAQTKYEAYIPHCFALDLTGGVQLDLSDLNWEQKLSFEERPFVATSVHLRPSYFGGKHWGGYADFGFNFFRFNDTERLFDVLMPGLGKLKPSLTVGATYRLESSRVQFHPRLGVGFLCYGSHSTARTFVTNDVTYTMRNKLSGNMFGLDAGVSAAYRISRICAIVLDVNFFQPIESGRVTRSVYEGESETPIDSRKIKSTTWGRTMNVSLGIRFQRSTR